MGESRQASAESPLEHREVPDGMLHENSRPAATAEQGCAICFYLFCFFPDFTTTEEMDLHVSTPFPKYT